MNIDELREQILESMELVKSRARGRIFIAHPDTIKIMKDRFAEQQQGPIVSHLMSRMTADRSCDRATIFSIANMQPELHLPGMIYWPECRCPFDFIDEFDQWIEWKQRVYFNKEHTDQVTGEMTNWDEAIRNEFSMLKLRVPRSHGKAPPTCLTSMV